jgi:hypothetical protein
MLFLAVIYSSYITSKCFRFVYSLIVISPIDVLFVDKMS